MPPEQPTVRLSLPGGVRIVVPDTLDELTPYVLHEQGDWFEDEIRFVRQWLRPGDQVVDIGANLGTYTLSMAHAVGPTGRVWAFEPTPRVAALLGQSIEANRFAHVTLEQSAVTREPGVGRFQLCADPEMNSLLHAEVDPGEVVEVRTVTLDQMAEAWGLRDLALVKIDAEGEESNILAGGARLFARHSPIVLCEVKSEARIDDALLEAFSRIGYRPFRLLSETGLLAPFDDPPAAARTYLFNLFFCSEERARELRDRGNLVTPADVTSAADPAVRVRMLTRIRQSATCHWETHLRHNAYAAPLVRKWKRLMGSAAGQELGDLFACHYAAKDPALDPVDRYAAVCFVRDQVTRIADSPASHCRLSTAARMAHEIGERDLAIRLIVRLFNALPDSGVLANEPFLPVSREFDRVADRGRFDDWFVSAVCHGALVRRAISTFYRRPEHLQLLEEIDRRGFAVPEVTRRLELLRHSGTSRRISGLAAFAAR